MSAPNPRKGARVDTLDPIRFYTPEQVAPVVGIKATPLRRYCRESGIHTRGPSNAILLTVANIKALHEWVINQGTLAAKEPDHDPFA